MTPCRRKEIARLPRQWAVDEYPLSLDFLVSWAVLSVRLNSVVETRARDILA